MLISAGAKILARLSREKFSRWETRAVELQDKVLATLIKTGQKTSFGKENSFGDIANYETFKEHVPIADYEKIKPWIERIKEGEKDVLWRGRPIYFAKTSGTTSGAKYIPITRDSLPNHIDSARNALLMYILKTGNTSFIGGKYIFLSGSPELTDTKGIPTGRLSGIAHNNIPFYLHKKRLPSYKTNCISDWEAKLTAIADETLPLNMSLISGIPPWVEMYFEYLLSRTEKKNILEIFPHFSILVHGGVSFNHYRNKLFRLIGREIDTLETFPASEGFFAFQDEFPSKGLLLIPDSGIFFEFIPAHRYYEENPPRLSLADVKPGVNYALILNSNAGLWGYSIGDTVKFTSVNPYRLEVTGRLNQFTSAFGEHVIGEEVENAINHAVKHTGAVVREFTLAPLVDNPGGLPCHQWFVEFKKKPENLEEFAAKIDEAIQEHNIYYTDLIKAKVLRPAMIMPVPKNTFKDYMKAQGKLGGQNKIPHLSNDRKIADWIMSRIQDQIKNY
jgi:hypothetical protein